MDHVLLVGPRLTCFYAGTVSLWTDDFGVGAVVVAETVGCGRVLREEFELREDGRRDRCEVAISWGSYEWQYGGKMYVTSAVEFDGRCGDRVNCTE